VTAFRGKGALLAVTSDAASDFGVCFAMSRFDGIVQLSVVEAHPENLKIG
jgi:hypothetical protein